MKTPQLYYWVIGILALSFCACKKDKAAPLNIMGKWVSQGSDKGQVYQDIYQFNADSSFSQTRLIADSASNQPVSYQYASNGKFHLNGTALQFYSVSIKYNSYYVPLDQLTSISSVNEANYTLALSTDGTEFHFVYGPCRDMGSCLGQKSYYKK
jgi:hypothetical protein